MGKRLKSYLNDMLKRKDRSNSPLARVQMDIFHWQCRLRAVIMHFGSADDCTGYRWQYCLKTKDDILKASKKWYSYMAELCKMHNLLMVIQDNAKQIQ
jgi:hypothetical protein